MQKDVHKFVIAVIIAIFLCWVIALTIPSNGNAEETMEMYVTANLLNGRAAPSKKSAREALFDKGDKVEATGKWSDDCHWIEIVGGETGTVWCDIRYLSERKGGFVVKNIGKTPVKIRKSPIKGKLTGYLKPGKTLTIDRVVLGWGYSERGWINLDYVSEE